MTTVSSPQPVNAADPTHPLWPVVLILGRIAERVEAHQLAEHSTPVVEHGDAAEQNPTAPQEVSR